MRSILVYSTNPENALYTARFTEVLQGQGNYVLVQSAANGRVYQWVAPDPVTCQPKGNFEPVIKLIAPELRQLYTAGADLQLGKNTSIQSELALSNRDLNRFSPLDRRDNLGAAAWLSLRQNLWPAGKAKAGTTVCLPFTKALGPTPGHQPLPACRYLRDWNLKPTPTNCQNISPAEGYPSRKKTWVHSAMKRVHLSGRRSTPVSETSDRAVSRKTAMSCSWKPTFCKQKGVRKTPIFPDPNLNSVKPFSVPTPLPKHHC
ncbi:MAG: hypothetical protein IPL65_06775 [Lewinellaceae bacterium]|nr:hypothetical protein [Lewinellaceae bacterium]